MAPFIAEARALSRIASDGLLFGSDAVPQEMPQATTVEWPYGSMDTVDGPAVYLDIARAGITYGSNFQMVKRASGDGRAVVLR